VTRGRRNAAHRRRRVAARHRLAGHWAEQPTPMLTSGKITYEVGDYVEATPYGGLAAMHRLVTRLGLAEAIDQRLGLLKIHLPYHESDRRGGDGQHPERRPVAPVAATAPATSSGPATAPAWSMASWTAKPLPRPTAAAAWEIMTSLAGLRMALPARSGSRAMPG
jgi:hypothetical protein